MIGIKNRLTGAKMLVAEDRVQEYIDRGHKEYVSAAEPAADPVKPAAKKKPAARSSARKKASD